MRQRRHGFTLIELLVVIGIILALIAILIAGFRHVSKAAAEKETVAELHVARGLLTEFENHAGLKGIESTDVQVRDTTVLVGNPARQFPVYQDLTNAVTGQLVFPCIRAFGTLPSGGYFDTTTTLPTLLGAQTQNTSSSQIGGSAFGYQFRWDLASDDSTSTDVSSRISTSARYTAAAIQRTRDVMLLLARAPANRNILQTVQTKRILEPPPGFTSGTSTLKPTAYSSDNEGPVLLDGWGNPIIFVPRGGIHVLMPDMASNATTPPNPTGEFVVRSNGIFPAPGSIMPPLTGNERPFFASAGQDGDFVNGEDNVYSFQE